MILQEYDIVVSPGRACPSSRVQTALTPTHSVRGKTLFSMKFELSDKAVFGLSAAACGK